ncbi:TPA: hypothetical protein OQU49_004348, partial [Shigella flexneri]|nr:hypothetical protein [Shigella flexneri]
GDLATNFGETATERLNAYENFATDFCELLRQGTQDEGMSEEDVVDEAVAASELAERDEAVLRDMLDVVIDQRCDTSQSDGLKAN